MARQTEGETDTADATGQELVQARAWASCLDRGKYHAYETSNGLIVQAKPSDDISRALEYSNEDLQSAQEAIRLEVRYYVETKTECANNFTQEQLVLDIAAARTLLENPPSLSASRPWDVPTLVAVAALEAHLLRKASLPNDALHFSADTVLRIGEGEGGASPYESVASCFERGADRSAARAMPLLLLPEAEAIRAVIDDGDGKTAFQRATRAGFQPCSRSRERSSASPCPELRSPLGDVVRGTRPLPSRGGLAASN